MSLPRSCKEPPPRTTSPKRLADLTRLVKELQVLHVPEGLIGTVIDLGLDTIDKTQYHRKTETGGLRCQYPNHELQTPTQMSLLTTKEVQVLVNHYRMEVVRWNPDENPNEIKQAQRCLEYWERKLKEMQT